MSPFHRYPPQPFEEPASNRQYTKHLINVAISIEHDEMLYHRMYKLLIRNSLRKVRSKNLADKLIFTEVSSGTKFPGNSD